MNLIIKLALLVLMVLTQHYSIGRTIHQCQTHQYSINSDSTKIDSQKVEIVRLPYKIKTPFLIINGVDSCIGDDIEKFKVANQKVAAYKKYKSRSEQLTANNDSLSKLNSLKDKKINLQNDKFNRCDSLNNSLSRTNISLQRRNSVLLLLVGLETTIITICALLF